MAVKQMSSGLWVGRTGGYIAVAKTEEECKRKLYPRGYNDPIYIGMNELEALREYLNEEKTDGN